MTFSAVTTTASWEPRIVPGLFFTTAPISYTAVGASSTSTLAAGSLILYGGETEGPSNPNNGSSTINVPSQRCHCTHARAQVALIVILAIVVLARCLT